jgi:hypothetical protein
MNIHDPILRGFLEQQRADGLKLASESDILELECLPTGQHFIAHFASKGLVKGPDNVVREAEGFHVCIFFDAQYLRAVNPFETVALLGPLNTYHPNVAFGAPFICLGHIAPGTPLVDLIFRCYEVLSYQRLTPREDDALNKEACRWARANQQRFPTDRRALKRRPLALEVERV